MPAQLPCFQSSQACPPEQGPPGWRGSRLKTTRLKTDGQRQTFATNACLIGLCPQTTRRHSRLTVSLLQVNKHSRPALAPHQMPGAAGPRSRSRHDQHKQSHVTWNRCHHHRYGLQEWNGLRLPAPSAHVRASVADPTAPGWQGAGETWFSGFQPKQHSDNGRRGSEDRAAIPGHQQTSVWSGFVPLTMPDPQRGEFMPV